MKSQVIRLTTVIGTAVLAASIAQAQYTENFDSYATGSDITGQGGWAQWANAAITDSAISTAFSHSGAKSLATELHADKVHTTSFTSGHWNWSVWSFMPATTQLPQWAVFLSSYAPAGPYFWVAQCELDPTLSRIEFDMGPNNVCGGIGGSQFGTVFAPLVVGAWTEIRLDIDLNADRCQGWYNNLPVGQVWQYTDGITAGFGLAEIGTIDLYANDNTLAGDRVYWDDVTVSVNANPTPECLGVGIVYCAAGTSTNGCVPTIGSTGVASASASSGFTVTLSNSEGQKAGIFFYGRSGQQQTAWGVGSSSFLCVKAPTQRTPVQPLNGTTNVCNGSYSIDMNAYMANNAGSLGNPRFTGETFDGQFWYRDPPAPKTTNLSDGLHWALKP